MAADKSLLNDNVYARLRELILSNQLRPGEKLVDRDLAARLDVSRTPVRHALGRLAMMGLVDARSRRGYYVAQYSPEQMSDLYEFRKILEVNSARLAAQNAKPAHLREFNDILSKLQELATNPEHRARTVEIDLQIHDLIARPSGNSALHQASRILMDKLKCFIWVDWLSAASVTDLASIASAHRDHQALLDRIIEKDAEGAAELMGVHIDKARQGLIKMLQDRAALRSVVVSAK
ncbi:MAG: GntR family transcriptional regulator [Woeseia sp.]